MSGEDEAILRVVESPEAKELAARPRTAVYVCRRNGDILWASQGFKNLFGYEPKELVGRNAWPIFAAPENLEQAAEASSLLDEGDIVVWLRLLRADGSRDWFRLDTLNRGGGVLLAFQREDDPSLRHYHYEPIGPRKS